MTPMPPIASTPPVQAAEPAQASAFQAAAGGGGSRLFADPAAAGRSILASLDSLQVRATHIQSITRAMRSGETPPAAAPASPAGVTPAATSGDSSQADRQQVLGVMLETYDFAMQTEMVTRAATTFTSSVNTLIKAQ